MEKKRYHVLFIQVDQWGEKFLDFTGNNTIIYDFPVTQIAESEKIDLEIIGINDLMVIDTLLFAFKASGYNDFFEMYSTDNWQYLGKFLSQGRGPDEFLSVQFSQDYFVFR